MKKCNNCQRPLSCGCQERVASNGQRCCNTCLQEYEAKIQQEKMIQQQNKQ